MKIRTARACRLCRPPGTPARRNLCIAESTIARPCLYMSTASVCTSATAPCGLPEIYLELPNPDLQYRIDNSVVQKMNWASWAG